MAAARMQGIIPHQFIVLGAQQVPNLVRAQSTVPEVLQSNLPRASSRTRASPLEGVRLSRSAEHLLGRARKSARDERDLHRDAAQKGKESVLLTQSINSAHSTQAVLRTYAANRETADGMNRAAALKKLSTLLRSAPRALWRTVQADEDFSRLLADCRRDYHSARLQQLPPQVAAGYLHGLVGVRQPVPDDIIACCSAIELHATDSAQTSAPKPAARHSFKQASGNEASKKKAFEFHAHKVSGAISAASSWFCALSTEAQQAPQGKAAAEALRQTLAATAAHCDSAETLSLAPTHAAVLLWASARLGVGLPLVQSVFARAVCQSAERLSPAHMTMALCSAAEIVASGHDVPLSAVLSLQGVQAGAAAAPGVEEDQTMCQAWVQQLAPAAAKACSEYSLLDLSRSCWALLIVQPSLGGGLSVPFSRLSEQCLERAGSALAKWRPGARGKATRIPTELRTALHAVCDLAGAVARFGGFAPNSREASVSAEAEAWASEQASRTAALLKECEPLATALLNDSFILSDTPQDRSVRARATSVVRHLKTRQVAALLQSGNGGLKARRDWATAVEQADSTTRVPSAFADILN